MAMDVPDWEKVVTVVPSFVAGDDVPDWEKVVIGPGNTPIGGGAAGLLATHQYAPSPRVDLNAAAISPIIDSTNLTISFTTTASGLGSTQVLVRLQATVQVQAGYQSWWSVYDHTAGTIYGYWQNVKYGTSSAEWNLETVDCLVTGLSASTSYQVDWAGYGNGGNVTIFALGENTRFGDYGSPCLMTVWAA